LIDASEKKMNTEKKGVVGHRKCIGPGQKEIHISPNPGAEQNTNIQIAIYTAQSVQLGSPGKKLCVEQLGMAGASGGRRD
jgi:hypothetical protein